jgi:carbon storage regulator
MLVLSRKIGERIVLPEAGVSIVLLSASAKRVRLGIEAPSGTTVHRAEVWQRILDLAGPPRTSPSSQQPRCPCPVP